jgi:anti-sigma B factor antagonist
LRLAGSKCGCQTLDHPPEREYDDSVSVFGGNSLAADNFSFRVEGFFMTAYRRLDVSEVGDVTVVRFRDRKIIEDINIQELGQELFRLVETDGRRRLLLDFSAVDFLSSAALGKLITLDKKMKSHGGFLKLANIRSEIYEVFAITKLNRLFDIRKDEADALAAF